MSKILSKLFGNTGGAVVDKLAGVASKVADSVVLKLAERGQKPIV